MSFSEKYINPHPHMRGPCGPRKTLPGGPEDVFGTPEPMVHLIVQTSNSGPILCIPFKLQCFVFGVRADPAATKLVSFFVNVYEG